MGGIFRVGVIVPVEGLHGEGVVHRHVRAGDIPPQQLDRLPVATGWCFLSLSRLQTCWSGRGSNSWGMQSLLLVEAGRARVVASLALIHERGLMVVMIYSVPLTILSSGVNGPENLALLDRTQPRSAARRKPRPFIAPSPAVMLPLCLRDALAVFCRHKYSRDQYLQNGFFSVSLLTSPPLLPPSPPFDHTPPAIGMCVRRSIRRQKGLGFQRRGRMSSGKPRRRGGGGSVLTKFTRRGGGARKGRGSELDTACLFVVVAFFFLLLLPLLGHLNHDGCLHACSKRGPAECLEPFSVAAFFSLGGAVLSLPLQLEGPFLLRSHSCGAELRPSCAPVRLPRTRLILRFLTRDFEDARKRVAVFVSLSNQALNGGPWATVGPCATHLSSHALR